MPPLDDPRMAFDGTLKYTAPDMVLFWQSSSVLSHSTPTIFILDDRGNATAEQFKIAQKTKHLGDEIAWHQAMRTPTLGFETSLAGGVHEKDHAVWER